MVVLGAVVLTTSAVVSEAGYSYLTGWASVEASEIRLVLITSAVVLAILGVLITSVAALITLAVVLVTHGVSTTLAADLVILTTVVDLTAVASSPTTLLLAWVQKELSILTELVVPDARVLLTITKTIEIRHVHLRRLKIEILMPALQTEVIVRTTEEVQTLPVILSIIEVEHPLVVVDAG